MPPPAARRPARLLRLRTRWRGSRANSAAETEASAPGSPARLGAGRRRRRQRRGRGRQDDADPRRLPGARGRGAGHLADLHDRPALQRRPAARSPTSTSTGSPASRARTRRCSTTTSTPTPSPSSSGPRWPSRASAGRRVEVRLGHLGGDRRSIEVVSASDPQIAVFRRGCRACSIGTANSNRGGGRRLMKGLKTLAAIVLGIALLASACARHGPGRRLQALRRLRPLRRTRNRRTSARRHARRAPSSTATRATSSTRSASNSRPSKNLCAPKQEAKQGTLYVNKITSNIPGKHKVTWFVEGKRVGSFVFNVQRVAGALSDRSASTRRPRTPPSPPWRDGEVLHESLLGLSEKGSPQHTTALLGEVERAAEAAGGWDAVERLAVGVGPGSFTGLRVGIATARALALSRGLPVRGVGTLDALGARARRARRRPAIASPSSTPGAARSSRPLLGRGRAALGAARLRAPRSSPSGSRRSSGPPCAPARARYDFGRS